MKSKISITLIALTSIFLSLGFLFPEQEKYLTILHTNDVHGRLNPLNYDKNMKNYGGLARRATIIRKIKNTNKNVLTVDAGDFAQGSLIFNFFNGVPDIQMMSEAGYDLITLGNHEFDKGLGVLQKMAEASEIPVLSANLVLKESPDLKKLIKPYVIKNYKGLKVGIIGLIAEDLKILARNLDNIEVLDLEETTRKIIAEIEPEVDLIVVVSHIGKKNDIKLAKNVPEIDLIVGGHSHSLLKQPVVINHENHKTLIIQAGEFGVYLGRLDLQVKNKEIKDYFYSLIPVNETIKEDKNISEKIAVLNKKVESLTKDKIGTLATPMDARVSKVRSGLTTAGRLVTESIKNKFPDVDVVLQNSGGIRAHKYIPAGDITTADVLKLFPFENSIVLVELQGKDLKSILETSSRKLPNSSGGFLQTLGLEYNVNISNKPQVLSDDGLQIITEGKRVSDIKINGYPLEEEKFYTIALNDYMFYGGNGYSQFKSSINVNYTGVFVQDAIIEYIKSNSPISPKVKDSIKLIH